LELLVEIVSEVWFEICVLEKTRETTV